MASIEVQVLACLSWKPDFDVVPVGRAFPIDCPEDSTWESIFPENLKRYSFRIWKGLGYTTVVELGDKVDSTRGYKTRIIAHDKKEYKAIEKSWTAYRLARNRELRKRRAAIGVAQKNRSKRARLASDPSICFICERVLGNSYHERSCGHRFHNACLIEYYESPTAVSCPCCSP
jgi:hypothetical protein